MKLLLLPNLLSEESSHELFLPPIVKEVVAGIQGIFAESEKEARRYLKRFLPHFREIPIKLLNEHTKESELKELLAPVLNGQTWGIISDAGLPCLADPGHQLVALAHRFGIEVEAFLGPSSLILGLMLSGLSAQRFAFHGYLPQQELDLKMQIRKLEQQSEKEDMTQLFIETPYRNQKMLETLLATLKDKTTLCVAWDLTMPSQKVISQPISTWKKMTPPQIQKKPTIFVFKG